jgi:hypothetical protein
MAAALRQTFHGRIHGELRFAPAAALQPPETSDE